MPDEYKVLLTVIFALGFVAVAIWTARQMKKQAALLAQEIDELLLETDAVVEVIELIRPIRQNREEFYTEYVVALPNYMTGLRLTNSNAILVRGVSRPSVDLDFSNEASTGDKVFDREFALADDSDTKALDVPIVRDQLFYLAGIFFEGVWVDDGKLHVIEKGRRNTDSIREAIKVLEDVCALLAQPSNESE